MEAVVIKKADVTAWVRGLLGSTRVVGPMKAAEGVVRYAPLVEGSPLVLDGLRPIRSPKEHFIPATEPLLTFRGSGAALTLEVPPAPTTETVILGVRACDARALTRLDDVFLGRQETDSLYQGRRKGTRLVGLACANPGWGCFCTSVGGSPAGTEGLDLRFTDLGERYHVAILTEAGRALLAGAAPTAATGADIAAAEAVQAAAIDRIPPRFDATRVAERLEWDAPLWSHHAKRCLGCGACSFLCPTCHCFDIQDEVTAEGGLRFRCWDTCQFGEFTRMGAGHNPRLSQTERVRQRLSHKFKYLVEEFGRQGCTGCGRCVEACPVNIDIRRLLAEIEGARR
jgi:ferredoxin